MGFLAGREWLSLPPPMYDFMQHCGRRNRVLMTATFLFVQLFDLCKNLRTLKHIFRPALICFRFNGHVRNLSLPKFSLAC